LDVVNDGRAWSCEHGLVYLCKAMLLGPQQYTSSKAHLRQRWRGSEGRLDDQLEQKQSRTLDHRRRSPQVIYDLPEASEGVGAPV